MFKVNIALFAVYPVWLSYSKYLLGSLVFIKCYSVSLQWVQDVLTQKLYLSLLHTVSASFKEYPAVPGCATEALDLIAQ